MDKQRLFELYEKTYFHEMEVREKLVNRVQINFALVATGYAVLSYMVRMVDLDKSHPVIGLFILSVLVSLVLSGLCVNFLLKAFWGNEYIGMPTATEIDNYRIELLSHRAEIEEYNVEYPEAAQEAVNVDCIITDFVYNKFRDCSSHNTNVNDRRSADIHCSFKWLLRSSVPFFFASILFILGDLDVSSPRKETPISNKSLTEQLDKIITVLSEISESISYIKGVEVSDKKEPPPPPPPPPQQPAPRRVIENDQPKRQL